MSLNKDKASAMELQHDIDKYEQGINKKESSQNRKTIQMSCYVITPEMGGKIVLSLFQKSKDHISRVSAEIKALE